MFVNFCQPPLGKRRNSLIPLMVLDRTAGEKHSSHVAFPPSFSSFIPSLSSFTTSSVNSDSGATPFNIPIADRAWSSFPWKRRYLGDSGSTYIPTTRIIPKLDGGRAKSETVNRGRRKGEVRTGFEVRLGSASSQILERHEKLDR